MLANLAYKYHDAHLSCSSAMLLCTTYIHHELIGTHVYIPEYMLCCPRCGISHIVRGILRLFLQNLPLR
jgi:hypothetical protein